MKISRILLGAAVVVAMTACGGNEKKDAECATEETAVEAVEEAPATEAAVEENTEATEENTEATETATETAEAAPAEAAK